MPEIFVNHSNHSSNQWSIEQTTAAGVYGYITDVPFPAIGADWEETEIVRLASENAERIAAMQPAAVMCQGEFTYTFSLVRQLLARHIRVVAACSERVVVEHMDEMGVSHRQSQFHFVRFREYV